MLKRRQMKVENDVRFGGELIEHAEFLFVIQRLFKVIKITKQIGNSPQELID
ncbi:unnamed protein product [Brugia timori]|uniref:Costars domain-containing protein n=1 Tax=Brugia timori TaxID=42155 RepID=A0A0R3R5R8_9BILA|nr:unnamed protein product [Brugia timori]